MDRGDVGWHIVCVNILHSSSIHNTLDFLIHFWRPNVETQRITLWPKTLVWWDLEFVKILSGIARALFDSTILVATFAL